MAVVGKNNAAATEDKKVMVQTEGNLTRSIGGASKWRSMRSQNKFFLRKLQKDQRNKNKNTYREDVDIVFLVIICFLLKK